MNPPPSPAEAGAATAAAAEAAHNARVPLHGARRLLVLAVGVASLGLGLLGVALPGLPTTPFVLLAAACFARSSPRLHGWLRRSRVVGPSLRDWEAHRSLTLRTKWTATGTMALAVALSASQLSARPGLQALLVVLGAIGGWSVWRLPTRRQTRADAAE